MPRFAKLDLFTISAITDITIYFVLPYAFFLIIKKISKMVRNKEKVWFVYDGECPLCQMGSRYYRLKELVGELQILDARTARDHPVMAEIKAQGVLI